MARSNEFGKWLSSSITVKIGVVGFLILILLVPTFMITDLIRERESRSFSVKEEIGFKWGNSQTIIGPVLTIPYWDYLKKKDEVFKIRKHVYILPDQLKVNGEMTPEIRYRSIYKVAVYNSLLSLEGSFENLDIDQFKIPDENLLWDEASISIGITDMRGIKNDIKVLWKNQNLSVSPGVTATGKLLHSGINSIVPIEKGKSFNFKIEMDINGSKALNFVPVGGVTEVNLSSSWDNPSFSGAFLPDTREISEQGFNAYWKVLHLNRNFPQKWITENVRSFYDSQFGIDLLMPVDHYQKSSRSAKYAIMFITLTFLSFFFSEILNKYRIHPIQYLLVGLALIVFYTLLISFSEQIGFNPAYIMSTAAIVILITSYSWSIFKRFKPTAIVGGILLLLYSFMFVVIQTQDFALLIGSVGLFFALAVIMYLTRNVKWFAEVQEEH